MCISWFVQSDPDSGILVFQNSRRWDGDWSTQDVLGGVCKITKYGENEGSKAQRREKLAVMPQQVLRGALTLGHPVAQTG